MRKSGDRELELVPSANSSGDGGGTAYEQPTESTHCLNLGTRREEDERAAEGDMEKNCRRRERQNMVFATWSEAVISAIDRGGWRRQVKGPILSEESL